MKFSTFGLCAIVIAVSLNTTLLAQAPSPLIKLQFNETTGVAPVNTGTTTATFTRTAVTPASSTNVPATVGGANSVDFGTTTGNYFIESTAPIDALKSLTSFTLTGWVNARSSTTGSGGNRILSWINNGGDGVDLVYQNNGSLRLGVDGWPDGSPATSSANKVTSNSAAPAGNWIFFAVTYQSNGQVEFYFGNNATDAVLDVTRTYTAPGITGSNISRLAIGTFNIASRSATSYDRMFRGLIDNIQIYNSRLDLTSIRSVQRGATQVVDTTPPSVPASFQMTDRSGSNVSFNWVAASDNVGVTGYQIWDSETLVTTLGTVTTYSANIATGSHVYSVKAIDAAGNASPNGDMIYFVVGGPNTVDYPVVDIKMENTFGAVINEGTAEVFFDNDVPPVSSQNVPANVGLQRSADFGSSAANSHIQATVNDFFNMGAFTLTGWINNKSNVVGTGGNRIISWLGSNGNGVDLSYQADGSLKLGVDERADNSPATSSANKVPTSAAASAANWTYFAVTYTTSGEVKYYFGSNAANATLDVTRSYPGRGLVGTAYDKFTVGTISPGQPNNGNLFKGLIDNVKVYSYALSAAEVVNVQRATLTDVTAPTAPSNLTVTSSTSTSVNLSWTAATDNVKVVEHSIYDGTTLLQTLGSETTGFLFGLQPGATYNLTVKARDAAGRYSPASNVVTTGTPNSPPLIKLAFNEPSSNFLGTGSLSGEYLGAPRSTNVPPGVGAPFSIDGASRSTNTVPLQGLQQVTVTGWLNCTANTTNTGGNPIVSWIGTSAGLDLVYQSDGSLRLGINEWASTSAAVSSTAKIPTNAGAAAANWVFFAVTYNSTGQASFYFGNGTQDATLDVTRAYAGRGALAPVDGFVGINTYFSPNLSAPIPGYTSIHLSGLIDDINLYGRILTPTEIVSVQRGPADTTPPTAPTGLSLTSKTNVSARLEWAVSGTDNVGVISHELYNGNTYVMSHYFDIRSPQLEKIIDVSGLTPGTTYNFNLRARDAHNNLSAASNTVVVTTDGSVVGSPLVYLNMDQSSGASHVSGGSAAVSFQSSPGGTPSPSSNVPATGATSTSQDFGTTVGNFYDESAAPIDGLKSLSSFTLTGWVNNKSTAAGSGGNRVISWINNGGDGVDLVYQSNGSLRLGVDGWPDGSPAVSSANKVTTSASAPASNWVFFAVTYQSNGQVQFFFGNNTADASLDVTRTYTAPGVTGANIGRLAIGAFNSASRGASSYDRLFRGLIDEIYIYGSVLTPQQIVAIQRGTGGNSGGRMDMSATPEPLIASEEPGLNAEMFQNYPNPFAGTTNIELYIPHSVRVARVTVNDISGRALQSIEVQGRGRTSVTVSSDNMVMGVYIYSFVADGKVVNVKRMAVTK